jgi:hypothetical protein
LDEKWDIRKKLQPQLAELWEHHPALLGHAMGHTGELRTSMTDLAQRDHDVKANRLRLLTPAYVRGHDHPFLPLVRESLLLTCSLDILFLRKDAPGSALRSAAGDLDNRLTTLFDGLRMPKENEMSGVSLDASPYHCLLEDDGLVTSLTIRTDRLLSRPAAGKNEVRLIIDVVVQPTRIRMEVNSGFVAD